MADKAKSAGTWAKTARVSADDPYAPRTIRSALPLEWVVGRLFDVWGVGEDVVICPLPDHREKTPSFNLWAPDPSGTPQKFGCFGCGERGDVIDLIRLAYGCGYIEAGDIAVRELIPEYSVSGFTPGAVSQDKISAETMRLNFRHMLDRGHHDTPFRHFLRRKGLTDAGHYARDEWRWGATETVVYMPHRGPDRLLYGVRLRSGGKKWSLGGSRFPHLYGAWRDRGREAILLCEGETDTVWAAWSLRHFEIDVVGLATGTAQLPSPQALALLRDRRVWIALDGDSSGSKAMERWRSEALMDIIEVPSGQDLLSCGIPVAELIGLDTLEDL